MVPRQSPASGPFDIAFTPDGTRAYVTDLSSNSVSVIDTTTNMVLTTIGSIPTPAEIAITPNGRFAYVAIFVSPGTVTVIDTATNMVFGTPIMTNGNRPSRAAINPHALVSVFITNTSVPDLNGFSETIYILLNEQGNAFKNCAVTVMWNGVQKVRALMRWLA